MIKYNNNQIKIYSVSLIVLCIITLIAVSIISNGNKKEVDKDIETYKTEQLDKNKSKILIDELKDKENKNEKDVYTEIYEIININTANEEKLKELNGFGDSIAKRVIEYRTINGDFKTIEDIMNVKGIGKSKYNKIKKYIEV